MPDTHELINFERLNFTKMKTMERKFSEIANQITTNIEPEILTNLF